MVGSQRKCVTWRFVTDLYDGFIESNKKEDGAERMLSLRSSVSNYRTICFPRNMLTKDLKCALTVSSKAP